MPKTRPPLFALIIFLWFTTYVVNCAPDLPAPQEVDQASETEAILAVVQKFFDTMTSKDAERARETLILDGQFMSIREGESPLNVRSTPLSSYIEKLGSRPRLQEERMWDPIVKVHRRIAMVWTPYDFHIDGKLTHCGVDVFTLLATADSWKIASVTYTVEPEGCEALGQPDQ